MLSDICFIIIIFQILRKHVNILFNISDKLNFIYFPAYSQSVLYFVSYDILYHYSSSFTFRTAYYALVNVGTTFDLEGKYVIGRFLQSNNTNMFFVIKASATAARASGPSFKLLLSQCPITLFHL